MHSLIFLPPNARVTILNSHGQYAVWWIKAEGFDLRYHEFIFPKSIEDAKHGAQLVDQYLYPSQENTVSLGEH